MGVSSAPPLLALTLCTLPRLTRHPCSHLPVAVWNDQPYDNVAIYTGSATIVNGIPTMVYPGLCKLNDWPACQTGTLLAIAVPADHVGGSAGDAPT